MKHIFARICGTVFAVSLLLAAVPAPTASAAGIHVTLDDAELSFSDAQPLMRNDRTFVPFRAIFESMGASVSWDDPSHTVTASRGDRTIKLTIGRKACVVDRAGSDRSFTTDAAPFIEGGRTYVPVRFAAQALGAAVGWDNATQTVIIVDTEKMMQTAFAGQFQTINTIVQFANSCAPITPRSVTGSLGATFTFHTAMGDIPSTLIGSLTGTESADAAQFTATLQTDRSSIESAIAANEGMSVIDENVDALLKKLANITVEGIISRTDSKLYLKSDFLTELGIPKGTWAMKPLDMSTGLTAVKNADGIDFVCAMAQQQALTLGSSVAQVRSIVASLSDQSSSPTEASAGNAVLRYNASPFTEVNMNLSANQA
ncbi:MAG: copper amine oxidase N-terminal domain-containing protein, partial [Butyricicoccus pullicaecorum]|nr:copper amine oxidase N-terminal domain-containing protein [Butyricicoccus pullicaecorum]